MNKKTLIFLIVLLYSTGVGITFYLIFSKIYHHKVSNEIILFSIGMALCYIIPTVLIIKFKKLTIKKRDLFFSFGCISYQLV
jgi:uncharacterized membrane protein